VPPAYLKSPAFPRIPSDQVPPCNYILDNGSYVGCTREREVLLLIDCSHAKF
jgi:hypothetical protein